MKKLLLLFILGAGATANAQVVINSADFPAIGESITFGDDAEIDAVALGFSLGIAGGGQTYDFSMLQTDELFEVGFYNPATVDGGTDFPTADLAVDQVGGIYAFAEVGAGEVNIIGLGGDFAEQLGSPIPIIVSMPASNPWKLFEFPASISSPVLTDTAVFEGEFFSDGLIPAEYSDIWDPDSVRVKRVIYYSLDIDADGSLTDPAGGVHSVIAANVVETSIDTIWGWSQTDGWALPDGLAAFLLGPTTETIYRRRYIGKEFGYYVADIKTDIAGTPESGTFVSAISECCTSVEEVVASGGNVLYPNPTADFVKVRTGGDIYLFEIMDMSGKLLLSTALTYDNQTVQLDGLADGIYIYRMIEENGRIAHTGRLSCIR